MVYESIAAAKAALGTCSHNQIAGSFCVYCGRVVPRVGEITGADREKAKELVALPGSYRESAIAQALADARVDLRVKQAP